MEPPSGGQEHPDEGEVLVLAEVDGVVVGGETGVGRPLLGAGEVAGGEPHPGRGGGDRPRLWGVVGVVALLGFPEQVEGPGVVAVGGSEPGLDDAPAVGVLAQCQVLAQLEAGPEVLGRFFQLVPLEV